MEKPIKPKRPTRPYLTQPCPTATEEWFPMMRWKDKKVVLMPSKDIPSSADESGDDFYEKYSYMKQVSLDSLSQLCKEQGLDPAKVSIESFTPHRYYDYHYISMIYSKTLSKAELEAQERDRQDKLDKFEKDMKAYESTKEKYKIATAEYNLWKAQQKVQRMRDQSEAK